MRFTTVDVLVEARRLIAQPNGWTQKASARDADNEWVGATSKDAVCFCAMGAITRAASRLTARGPDDYSTLLAINKACSALTYPRLKVSGKRYLTSGWLEKWNDDPIRKVEDVVDLFDAVIVEQQVLAAV